ncbi:hypothetical protein [Alkalibacillus almallahensis]|uniref:hypothetical protein n=1 Tax=Alkalibacillus almallahensis TaxID=1379154 RepID=UPI00141EB6E2|nr:hypothetical protein [Alkalibacillus almallahensis]NIK10930.1 gas vesicle protein [Alkalibacillus almallahensis]
MSQDVNKILDDLSNQFAQQLSDQSIKDKRAIAILREENERLKNELDKLKNDAE